MKSDFEKQETRKPIWFGSFLMCEAALSLKPRFWSGCNGDSICFFEPYLLRFLGLFLRTDDLGLHILGYRTYEEHQCPVEFGHGRFSKIIDGRLGASAFSRESSKGIHIPAWFLTLTKSNTHRFLRSVARILVVLELVFSFRILLNETRIRQEKYATN